MHAGEVGKEHELLDSMPDAVVVSDRDGKIVYANRQAKSLTGYSRSELIGRNFSALIPAGLHATQAQRRGSRSLIGRLDSDFHLRRKDGTRVAVEIAFGTSDEDTVAVIRDFT